MNPTLSALLTFLAGYALGAATMALVYVLGARNGKDES